MQRPRLQVCAAEFLECDTGDSLRRLEGRVTVLPNVVVRVDTLGLDTIAGAKLLQLKFGSAGAFQPDRAVMHGDRRARFIRMSEGAAIIRHCGSSHPVAVALETLSLPPGEPARVAATADTRQAGAFANRSRLRLRTEVGRFRRNHPQRRPLLRP